ncbi:hypothetical protein B7R74_04760 [Yersinia pseudotuberculosis]|nr:hypothetical protein B7R74_04760 [Yersinia pseudotuberculosis]
MKIGNSQKTPDLDKAKCQQHSKIPPDFSTFVSDLKIKVRRSITDERFTPSVLGDSWDWMMKRAKLRHRNAYQSRHTYACLFLSAGKTPSFIATQMGHPSALMPHTCPTAKVGHHKKLI